MFFSDYDVYIIGLLLLAGMIFFFWGVIGENRAFSRTKEAEKLIRELEKSDSSWNLQIMKSQAQEAFIRITEARYNKKLDPVKDLMTPDLYIKLKKSSIAWYRDGDPMALNRKMVIVRPISVYDRKDDAEDGVWIKLSVGGLYEQIWGFVRGPKGWLADEILGEMETPKFVKKNRSFVEK